MYLIEHIITGEIAVNMDKNGNGKSDVIENTLYDYKCDRSDLELPDYGDFSDADAEGSYDSADEDTADNDVDVKPVVADEESAKDENNDVDAETSATKKSGCSVTVLGDLYGF